MDDDMPDTEQEKPKPRRAGHPRFGPFVTITAAILLLFGAASRVGKMEETFALFGLDRLASNRIQREEDRLRAALHTIGAVPTQRETLHPPTGSVSLRSNVPPPYRGEIDPEDVRDNARAPLSLGVPSEAWGDEQPGIMRPTQPTGSWAQGEEQHSAMAPAAPVAQTSRLSEYIVEAGDTWNRIAKKTLGDGSRWQEIRKANPNAESGLNVGMRLAIPAG